MKITDTDERLEMFVGMALKEALKDIGPNIRVGMENGNSYVFCGETKVLKANLYFVNEMVRRTTEKRYEAAVARARTVIRNENVSMAGYLKKCAREVEQIEDIAPTMDGFMEYLSEHMDRAIKTARAVVPHREKCETFKPLAERKITRIYRSISDKSVVCVLIEGRENGWFWDAEECAEVWEVVDGKLKSIKGAELKEKED